MQIREEQINTVNRNTVRVSPSRGDGGLTEVLLCYLSLIDFTVSFTDLLILIQSCDIAMLSGSGGYWEQIRGNGCIGLTIGKV